MYAQESQRGLRRHWVHQINFLETVSSKKTTQSILQSGQQLLHIKLIYYLLSLYYSLIFKLKFNQIFQWLKVYPNLAQIVQNAG